MSEVRLPPPPVKRRWLVVEDGLHLLDGEAHVDGATQWVDVDIAQLENPEVDLLTILNELIEPGELDVTGEDLDSAVNDLLDSDEWPDMAAIGPFRKLSLTCLIPTDPNDRPRRDEHGKEPDPPVLDASRVEVLLTRDWVISAWHPITRITQSADQNAPLPNEINWLRYQMEEVVEDTVDTDKLTTGGDIGIALIRGAIATFSGHRKDLHKRLDDWEHEYYQDNFGGKAGSTTAGTARGARNTTKVLAEIHAAGVDMSRELDHLGAPRDRAALHWVGKGTASPEGEHAAEIYDEKIDRYRSSLRDIRDRVRAGLDLSHSVESTARDEAGRRRDAFIAKVAAVFLAPTLVAGFYGINTDYPGSGTALGTVEALALMVLSAIGAWRGIVWHEKRQQRKRGD